MERQFIQERPWSGSHASTCLPRAMVSHLHNPSGDGSCLRFSLMGSSRSSSSTPGSAVGGLATVRTAGNHYVLGTLNPHHFTSSCQDFRRTSELTGGPHSTAEPRILGPRSQMAMSSSSVFTYLPASHHATNNHRYTPSRTTNTQPNSTRLELGFLLNRETVEEDGELVTEELVEECTENPRCQPPYPVERPSHRRSVAPPPKRHHESLLHSAMAQHQDYTAREVFQASFSLESFMGNQRLLPQRFQQRYLEGMSNATHLTTTPVSTSTSIRDLGDTKKAKRARLCQVDGCDKYVVDRGLCVRHGGGKRCYIEDCQCRAQYHGLCWKHGGYKMCTVEGCKKRAKSRGICWSHGGGTRCSRDNCDRVAVSRGLCWAHGGGKRCRIDGCQRPASRKQGDLCAMHLEAQYKESLARAISFWMNHQTSRKIRPI